MCLRFFINLGIYRQHRECHQNQNYENVTFAKLKPLKKKNFVPHCPETLRYAKIWGRNIVRSLTLAYTKRLLKPLLLQKSTRKQNKGKKVFQIIHEMPNNIICKPYFRCLLNWYIFLPESCQDDPSHYFQAKESHLAWSIHPQEPFVLLPPNC